jgi:hypothetical protein
MLLGIVASPVSEATTIYVIASESCAARGSRVTGEIGQLTSPFLLRRYGAGNFHVMHRANNDGVSTFEPVGTPDRSIRDQRPQ